MGDTNSGSNPKADTNSGGDSIVSLIPQLFYDIIARLAPGVILLCTFVLAFAGPENMYRYFQSIASKTSESYPPAVVVIGIGLALSYGISVVLWGIWWLFDQLVLNRKADIAEQKKEASQYDYIKKENPAIGNRIAKLKAESHMAAVLGLGFFASFLINLCRMHGTADNLRWILLVLLPVAILGSYGARHHFESYRKISIESNAKLLGYDKWVDSQNALKTTSN